MINKMITRIEAVIIATNVLIVSIVLIANVFCRWFLHFSIAGAEEIGQMGLIFITFIGLSYCITTGRHINMLALFDILPWNLRKLDAVVISLVTCLTCAILTYISFVYVNEMSAIGKVTVNLGIPWKYLIMVIAVSFLFATFQYFLVFLLNIIQKDEVFIGLNAPYQVPVKEVR